METIKNREAIFCLVEAFYAKIQKNELLGPVFNRHISAEQWPEHLEKLTDFWETNLFGIAKFKGSPSAKHVTVDKHMNHSITQEHFEVWLQLWFETIDQRFEGELAVKAKQAARKMATGQYLTIWNNRTENKKPTANAGNRYIFPSSKKNL